ncbi:MAG: hypothetical protein JW940_16200 [Polyangiaceae bacterium]|nr:hypothetical protein [Polyangiaceae bacterium]
MARVNVSEGANIVGRVDMRVFVFLLALATAGGCGGRSRGPGGSDAGAAAGASMPSDIPSGGEPGSGAGGTDVSVGTGGDRAPDAGGAGGAASSAGGASPAGGASAGGGRAAGAGRAAGGTSAGGSLPAGGMAPSGGVSDAGGSQPEGGVSATGGADAGGSGVTGGGAIATGGAGAIGGGATVTGGGGTTTGGAGETGANAGSGAESTGGQGTGGWEPCAVPTATPGTPITFNDNGGWLWHQDERAIVDVEAKQLIIGSVPCGGSRNGHQEAVIYDLAGGTPSEPAMVGSGLSVDPNNAPALIQLNTGKYLAVWTGHNENCNSYYNVYDNGSWGTQQAFDWGPIGCPTDNRTISYSNLWQMPGRIFNFVRSVGTSPNLITTTDGSTFTYAGRLTNTPQVGYVAGYYKYWGNNVDRIDFVGTEAHPRDNDNSLYHGYIKATETAITTYDSMGTQKGTIDEASKTNAPSITAFTKIFATGTTIKDVRLEHMWSHDIVRYDDGTIVVLAQGRVSGTGTTDPDKRFIYLRFDGSSWSATYLVKGGNKLSSSEEDYTGLGAIHPNNPYTIYVSTTYDPRDETTTAPSTKREIWRGTTCDQGKSFTWTPITQNSTQDNVRPIVPYWSGGKTALLWLRGFWGSESSFTSSVVGLIMDGP